MHILICPLNWGLGHAGRMIPLIRQFLDRGCTVTVASEGMPMQLIKEEFGVEINYYHFPGATIRYSSRIPLMLKLLLQAPAFLASMIREKNITRRIVSELQPQIIISDNRYKVRDNRIFSVFITHQLWLRLPQPIKWFENFLNFLNHRMIKRYDMCLVPDDAESPGLSGKLSHHIHLPGLEFGGPLSRFSNQQSMGKPLATLPNDFILVLLSGPEPQRTVLERLLMEQLNEHTCVWFRGLPGNHEQTSTGSHYFFNHGTTATLSWCIQHSKLVIARSGYSSVMDLAVFGKKCVLIPTPGQTEQEYLGVLLQKYIVSLPQERIGMLEQAITQALLLPGLPQHEQTAGAAEIILSAYKRKMGNL